MQAGLVKKQLSFQEIFTAVAILFWWLSMHFDYPLQNLNNLTATDPLTHVNRQTFTRVIVHYR
ncbi:MAG: hypothetical protein HQ555_11695 [Candidatus Aminicenantes bacterium]|nr:hypothetical protein [Candidatus Aminicenantes bacterium]